MKYIFICANYAGLEENYFKFLRYCKYVADKGHVPISIVTMYHSALDENVPAQNDIITSATKQLLNICDEVWVFGKCSQTLIANVSESGSGLFRNQHNCYCNYRYYTSLKTYR